jgi:hypothetical protein
MNGIMCPFRLAGRDASGKIIKQIEQGKAVHVFIARLHSYS